MTIIRKFIILINRRPEIDNNTSSPTTTSPNQQSLSLVPMQLRSGRQYHFEEPEASDDDDEVLLNSSVAIVPMNEAPENQILIQPSTNEGRKDKAVRLLRLCCGVASRTVWRIIQTIPAVLAAVAGVHAINQIINPPEQKIEINISQKNNFWWW